MQLGVLGFKCSKAVERTTGALIASRHFFGCSKLQKTDLQRSGDLPSVCDPERPSAGVVRGQGVAADARSGGELVALAGQAFPEWLE